ncbi:MAG TPA: GAF domain-containing protein, partial [Anaerolineae bacterium]|nr:GAF domain-containing protein [Anaerolineae bacterium]
LFSETREARDAVLSVLEDLNEAMTREQVRVQELERLTEQLATANEESDRLAAQLAAINRLDHVISSSLELEEIYRAFAEESRKIIPFDCMSVALVEEDQVRMLALGTEMETALGAELVFPLAGSAIEAVMESGQPLIRCDLVAEERYPLDRQLIAAGLRSSVLVPLVAKGRVLGSFNVDSCQVGAYGQEDLAILQSLADQLAIAIENARLYEMERQAREEAEALRDATATLVGSLELNQMLERILNGVHRVIPHDAANIALIEGDMVHFVRWRGYERFGMNTQMPGLGFHIADTPNFRHMVETGQPVVIPDTAVAPEWIQVPGWEWIRSYVGTPIQVREKLIGFLNLDSATPGFFNADHARLLAAFAQQIGLALENARLFEETQRRLRELSALFEVSRALRGAESVEEMLPIILEKTMEVLEADTGALFRVDERTEEFVAQVAQGRLESLLGLRLGPTEGMCGYVAQTRAPYPFTNLARDPHTGARVQALVEGVQGGICVPLLVGETLVGTLVIGNDEPRTFSDDELRLLTAIADMAASAIHRASLFEELQQVNAKLSRTLKLQEEMIQNVSHELRTPLALIRGYAELMEQGGLGMLQPEQADAVRVIVERSQQLGRMIDLLIAIQDADWQPPRLEQVDLVMLVQEVTTAWRARTETKGFHLQLLSDVETLLVPADRKKLRQALDNLLDNAFKFSHPGSQVTVRVWYEEGTARLAVSDQGIGLTPEQLEQVFERFYQADGGMTRRYGGLGLGLALCKEIVAAHGGRIWVESAGKGKGSTFHVTLPAAWEHEAPVPRKHSALVTH